MDESSQEAFLRQVSTYRVLKDDKLFRQLFKIKTPPDQLEQPKPHPAVLDMLLKQPQINKCVRTCRASSSSGNRKPICRFFERSKMKMRKVAKKAEEVKKKASLQQQAASKLAKGSLKTAAPQSSSLARPFSASPITAQNDDLNFLDLLLQNKYSSPSKWAQQHSVHAIGNCKGPKITSWQWAHGQNEQKLESNYTDEFEKGGFADQSTILLPKGRESTRAQAPGATTFGGKSSQRERFQKQSIRISSNSSIKRNLANFLNQSIDFAHEEFNIQQSPKEEAKIKLTIKDGRGTLQGLEVDRTDTRHLQELQGCTELRQPPPVMSTGDEVVNSNLSASNQGLKTTLEPIAARQEAKSFTANVSPQGTRVGVVNLKDYDVNGESVNPTNHAVSPAEGVDLSQRIEHGNANANVANEGEEQPVADPEPAGERVATHVSSSKALSGDAPALQNTELTSKAQLERDISQHLTKHAKRYLTKNTEKTVQSLEGIPKLKLGPQRSHHRQRGADSRCQVSVQSPQIMEGVQSAHISLKNTISPKRSSYLQRLAKIKQSKHEKEVDMHQSKKSMTRLRLELRQEQKRQQISNYLLQEQAKEMTQSCTQTVELGQTLSNSNETANLNLNLDTNFSILNRPGLRDQVMSNSNIALVDLFQLNSKRPMTCTNLGHHNLNAPDIVISLSPQAFPQSPVVSNHYRQVDLTKQSKSSEILTPQHAAAGFTADARVESQGKPRTQKASKARLGKIPKDKGHKSGFMVHGSMLRRSNFNSRTPTAFSGISIPMPQNETRNPKIVKRISQQQQAFDEIQDARQSPGYRYPGVLPFSDGSIESHEPSIARANSISKPLSPQSNVALIRVKSGASKHSRMSTRAGGERLRQPSIMASTANTRYPDSKKVKESKSQTAQAINTVNTVSFKPKLQKRAVHSVFGQIARQKLKQPNQSIEWVRSKASASKEEPATSDKQTELVSYIQEETDKSSNEKYDEEKTTQTKVNSDNLMSRASLNASHRLKKREMIIRSNYSSLEIDRKIANGDEDAQQKKGMADLIQSKQQQIQLKMKIRGKASTIKSRAENSGINSGVVETSEHTIREEEASQRQQAKHYNYQYATSPNRGFGHLRQALGRFYYHVCSTEYITKEEIEANEQMLQRKLNKLEHQDKKQEEHKKESYLDKLRCSRENNTQTTPQKLVESGRSHAKHPGEAVVDPAIHLKAPYQKMMKRAGHARVASDPVEGPVVSGLGEQPGWSEVASKTGPSAPQSS